MTLPSAALHILRALNTHGYEAYAVGGAVRDLLRGIRPDDIDITTNASPDEVLRVFASYRTIPTGLQHGTVTVLIDSVPYEVTTYRTDGNYSDGRHPDSIRFTSSLTEDLARRDFTVNAMAFHPERGIVDPFGGQQDLINRRLRCVGNAATRFSEDALRIARLLRFISVLGFEPDTDTLTAAHALVGRLDLVAAERKRVELEKCLLGAHVTQAALLLPDVMSRIVPPLAPCIGFQQHNPHHAFDVYEHTVRAVGHASRVLSVRLAVLLHDVGKPACFTRDDDGIGHFYGHPSVSHALACDTLKALRFDNATVRDVLPLVKYHDIPLEADRALLKKRLRRFGYDTVNRLLDVKTADAAGCFDDGAVPRFDEVRRIIGEIYSEDTCLTLKALAVNGNDLLALGIPKGPTVGRLLQQALDAVVDDALPNTREALLTYVKERWMP